MEKGTIRIQITYLDQSTLEATGFYNRDLYVLETLCESSLLCIEFDDGKVIYPHDIDSHKVFKNLGIVKISHGMTIFYEAPTVTEATLEILKSYFEFEMQMFRMSNLLPGFYGSSGVSQPIFDDLTKHRDQLLENLDVSLKTYKELFVYPNDYPEDVLEILKK